ncbi:hypothetical protein Bca52824_086759 [Brassica carinata]|uniref:Replication protein A 70 kDa DNA-binding subunit B/D first OB fold domain-containing protein n=1 Tax=Brassica carinata TaxID=52824 RepID=A0A8X7TP74_BRACI|nr:hypothetical protein Bca52824_086759 [Brassica carinata]
MANNASLKPVKDLKPFKTKWRSQVKVLHSWLQNTGSGGETLQMVLTDEQGEKISATCKRNHILSVQRKLPQGKWCVLTTFSVSQASGQYRPTSHPYKITISDETVITNSDLIQDSIFLSLARYEDIIDGNLKTNFLIGNTSLCYGKIVSLEPVQTVQVKGQDRKKVQFRLVDANGKDLACCLWGKYVEQLEAYVECEQPLICLIRFAKISFYKGEVKITNAFDASIVYLDPTMEEALQFKEKLVEDELPLAVIEKKNGKKEIVLQEDDWNKLEIKMILELFVENCKIICSTEAVDTDWAWFYFGHKGCKHRAIKLASNHDNNQLWRCEKCQVKITEVIPIEDPELLPEPIRALEGKSFCFGISVNSDNAMDGAGTFKVLEVWSGDHILKVESQSEPTSMTGTSSSTLSSGDLKMCLLMRKNSLETMTRYFFLKELSSTYFVI